MSVVTERMKCRTPRRKQFMNLISETDPSPQIPSMIQSTRCKSTFSSLLSSFSHTSNANGHNNSKEKNKKSNRNFSAATFRGLGCTAGAPEKVLVPAVIQSSAEWRGKKKSRKKKQRRNSNSNSNSKSRKRCDEEEEGNGVDFQHVWCGPGIGFSTYAASSVDCVVARKKDSAKAKLDAQSQRISHRGGPSYFERRTMMNTESISFLNEDADDIFRGHIRLESFGTARFYRHLPHPSPDDLAEHKAVRHLVEIYYNENKLAHKSVILKILNNVVGTLKIMMIQGRAMGQRFSSHDQFREWRLDIDNMSYEQLLELSERIGYVNTGLKEDEVGLNIRKVKLLISNNQIDKKCSICQEEYETDEELGRLNCEHSYHFQCIKQWLMHKNFCPVCKQEVVVRH